MPEVYGVFEGGGVRGTALVGGVAAAEEKGITFRAVAGTSAGAIVASLLAAGYNAAEMRTILMDASLKRFMDPHSPVPGINQAIAMRKLGLNKGDFFLNWIREHLSQKIFNTPNKSPTFAQMKLPLKVVSTALMKQEATIFSLETYANMPVADAVRMSMSIPGVFQPVRMHSVFVDGGAVSNFPAWIFVGEQEVAPLPILGLRLLPDDVPPKEITTPVQFIMALGFAMMKASLPIQNSRVPGLNVIELPTLRVSTTDFGISEEMKAKLYDTGYSYAMEQLKTLVLRGPA